MAKRGVAKDPPRDEECVNALQDPHDPWKTGKEVAALINLVRQGQLDREQLKQKSVESHLHNMAAATNPLIQVKNVSPRIYALMSLNPVPSNPGDPNVSNAPNQPPVPPPAPQPPGIGRGHKLFSEIVATQNDPMFPVSMRCTEDQIADFTETQAPQELDRAQMIVKAANFGRAESKQEIQRLRAELKDVGQKLAGAEAKIAADKIPATVPPVIPPPVVVVETRSATDIVPPPQHWNAKAAVVWGGLMILLALSIGVIIGQFGLGKGADQKVAQKTNQSAKDVQPAEGIAKEAVDSYAEQTEKFGKSLDTLNQDLEALLKGRVE